MLAFDEDLIETDTCQRQETTRLKCRVEDKMRHDFVFIFANNQISEMQNCRKLFLPIYHLRVLYFFFLNSDPNVLVLLKVQNFFSFAQLLNLSSFLIRGWNTLNYSEDEWITSAIPLKGVEFLFIYNRLKVFKRFNFVSRNDWSDNE